MDPTEGIGNQQEQIGLESDSLESAAVALATGVTRRRQRTEKGKSYIAHLRWTDCQTIDKRIERQIKEIVSLTTTEENVDVVERNLTAFRVIVEELRRSVAVLLDDLEGEAEQLNIANDWYAERSKQISDFIEKTVRWISSAKDVIEESLDVRSRVSSKPTRTSHRSHASSRSLIASSRAKEKAKAAELMAKVAMLEQRQELEKRAERLRLEEQLAVAQVRERVFASEMENGVKEDLIHQPEMPPEAFRVPGSSLPGPFFQPVSNIYTVPSTAMNTVRNVNFTTGLHDDAPVTQAPPKPTRHPAKLNPLAPEFHVADTQPNKQFCDILQKQNRLTELLVEQQQQSLLPSLTLTKFSGDPLEYSTFTRSFESQVEAKVSANDVRLQYLEQYLQGEPKELIKGCLHLDRNSGYIEAKKLLKEKYGDPYKISNAYIKKINEWPYIRSGDELALDRLSIFLDQCRSAMSTLTFLSILDHPHNLQSMVSKLPFSLQDRWRREANKRRLARGTIPTFDDFVNFVNTEAEIATDPVFSREALRRLDGSSDRPDRSNKGKGFGNTKTYGDRARTPHQVLNHATDVTADQMTASRNSAIICKLCKKGHDLDDCQAYLKKSLLDRKEFLKEKELCFACYDPGHRSNGCAQRRTCKKCSRRHPTGLHDDNFRINQVASMQQVPPPPQRKDHVVNAHTEMAEATCNATGTEKSISAVPIVPVLLRSAESEVLTYAMLDACSTGSFVLEDIVSSLGVEGTDTQLVVKTVNGSKLHDAKVLNGLVVSDLKGDNAMQLPKIFTKKDLSTCENAPSPDLAHRWKHLKGIEADLPPQLPNAKIGLLIGTNCPKALEPIDVLASEDGGPFAIKTFAGWAVVGPLYMCNDEHPTVNCHRVAAMEVCSGRHLDHHFMVENKVREIVSPQVLNKMFELDFSERTDDKEQAHSQEDKKFLEIVAQGIAAPFLLVGKSILQDLCRTKLSWDEEIGEEYRVRWENWKSQLPALERFSMERCLKPANFGTVVSRQIHNFSDASSTGYGQVTYLRIENEKGDIHCAFLMGKARVAPVKTMTIPRLELTAATVSVRVGEMIAKELDEPAESKTYWTDSTTVLKYIRNNKKRFHVFVANRVQTIRDATNSNQWRYVGTDINPVDDSSRGLKGHELSKQHRWITGPNFLWLPESEWPQLPADLDDVSLNDPEVKKVLVHSMNVEENVDLLNRLTRFSEWQRMKRSIAWILRLKPNSDERALLPKDGADKVGSAAHVKRKPLRVEELDRAEKTILKLVQRGAFPKEIEALQKVRRVDCESDRQFAKAIKSEIKKSSTLYRLDPFLDPDGLIRVGGRLSKSEEFSESFKHPVILPKKSFVVSLIVGNAHAKVAHAGRGVTLSELRSQYWILSANSVVRHFISKCVVCRRLRGSPGEQKMADLPKERITPSPPFTYSGVDYFGPFYIKQGRKDVKRYGVLFTCLASRAVHIETADTLETDSFINALRRFVARRGPVREVRSDQGTNIVGAERELKKALDELDHSAIQRSLSRDFNADWIIQWKQNPPAASHMGGVWERQIRSVRSTLSALMRNHGHTLDDESFRTLLTEVECIINSRPLTVPSSDPEDLDPLTPNHILTMKSRVVMPPPGNFQKADLYLRKRWKRVQYLSNVFWSRWRKEYVQNLQQRVKWNRPRRNFEKGDLVLIVDDRAPRNDWSMARVIDVHPDSNGQVRSVRVTTATTTLDRPIDKLVLILENEE